MPLVAAFFLNLLGIDFTTDYDPIFSRSDFDFFAEFLAGWQQCLQPHCSLVVPKILEILPR
jgi:hypothetical protein